MRFFPMKRLLFILCARWLLATVPCPAQEAAADSTPLLLVYVARFGETIWPRIALGLEKPVLRVAAFEKCVRMSTLNPNFSGLAAQLRPEDARTLAAAMKAMAAPGATTVPRLTLWFATPDNKVLDHIDTLNGESNILDAGIIEIDPPEQETLLRFLDRNLHPH